MGLDSSGRRNAVTIAFLLFLGLIFADVILAFYMLRERILPDLAMPPDQPGISAQAVTIFLPLVISQPEPPAPTPGPTSPATESVNYIVKAGDTLLCIANRYGVDLDELAKSNQIENVDFILVGQELVIRNPPASQQEAEARATPHPGCP